MFTKNKALLFIGYFIILQGIIYFLFQCYSLFNTIFIKDNYSITTIDSVQSIGNSSINVPHIVIFVFFVLCYCGLTIFVGIYIVKHVICLQKKSLMHKAAKEWSTNEFYSKLGIFSIYLSRRDMQNTKKGGLSPKPYHAPLIE